MIFLRDVLGATRNDVDLVGVADRVRSILNVGFCRLFYLTVTLCSADHVDDAGTLIFLRDVLGEIRDDVDFVDVADRVHNIWTADFYRLFFLTSTWTSPDADARLLAHLFLSE